MNYETDIGVIWNSILPSIENSLTKPIYETLITSAKPLSLTSNKFVIAVPNEVIKEWLSKHCITLLEQEIKNINQNISRVDFIIGPDDLFETPALETSGFSNSSSTSNVVPSSTNEARSSSKFLSPRYTFDTFVVGHGNRFAHAASLAVAESPASAYNPLFLYGGVGLGKTHLMQAIGHHALNDSPKSKVLYITSEIFTNDLINSIRDDKTIEFRNKYRNIDILLVDDIQFLAGKERTQEEFFHTFNALYEANKQIVVSSDRPPKEIPTLEERLRSRFEWGLIADIQSPDFETRIAILKKKAELGEMHVDDSVLVLIASKITSNIRELEGALVRVVAYASLTGKDISVALADEVLKDIIYPSKDRSSLSIDLIKKMVAEYYSIKIDDLNAKIRTKEIAMARQIAMYLSRELTGSSLPKIGNAFGGRDHTTVMHACEKIKNSIKNDPGVESSVKTITQKLKKFNT